MLCLECQKEIKIAPWSKVRTYCSSSCRIKSYNRRAGKMKALDLPPSTVGRISELMVSLDLLKKGYEVYNPITPNCSGDILIEKNNLFKKIEVRTGWRNNINGKIIYPTKNIRTKILAIYLAKEDAVVYFGDDLI